MRSKTFRQILAAKAHFLETVVERLTSRLGHKLNPNEVTKMPRTAVRPKTLYWFEHHAIEKHRLTDQCMVEVVSDNPDGVRYRCRAMGVLPGGYNGHVPAHDVYGWGTLKEAKADEIHETKRRINSEIAWLNKLTGRVYQYGAE